LKEEGEAQGRMKVVVVVQVQMGEEEHPEKK
jgi:hypothetical protein